MSMEMSNRVRRRFIEHLFSLLLNLDEASKEAITYARQCAKRPDLLEHHARFWEGLQWGVKLLADNITKAEKEEGLFDKQVDEAIARLEKVNDRQKEEIARLRSLIEQMQADGCNDQIYVGSSDFDP